MLSDLVVCYLFLGGAGAGLVFALCALGLLAPREVVGSHADARRPGFAPYRSLFGPAFVAALVALALGIVCLLADLGAVDRAFLLLAQPRPTYLTVGAWALVACSLFAALLALAWLGIGPVGFVRSRPALVLAAVVALVVMVYTGLLLQSLGAVPLWASSLLPALFVASSLSCGMAALLAFAQFTGASRAFGTVLARVAAFDAAVIVVEACVVAAFVFVASAAAATPANGTEIALAQSARELVAGQNAWLFWGAFVALGLAVPFALDLALARGRRAQTGLALFAAACVLVGGFTMRFCVVAAGAHPVLVSMGVM